MTAREPRPVTGALPRIPAPADPSPKVPPTRTPVDSWTALREGNARFVEGRPAHPGQSTERRRQLAASQHPHTVVFGCSDSRVPAEIIFDQGLGDVFVVRTAGHCLDATVIGSIEYGTEILGASLVVVLGHESCGAIAATVHTLATGEEPPGFARTVVDRVLPSVVAITSAAADGRSGLEGELFDADKLRTAHVVHTVARLRAYSVALNRRVENGDLAIVGAEYDLTEGVVRMVDVAGDVGEGPSS